MGLAAAAVAGSATLVYTLSHRETRWQQARRQAGRMASRTGEQLRPWASVAAGALISLAAASRNRKAWEQTNGAKKMVQSATGQLAGTGLSLFRRVQRISGETKKLYPSVRKLIA
ncbi:MAG: hypothetical protein C5B51_07430 [Terriglobia bacterium]|nr:MAG: hypothetical protein C5B51_07430 [Terriglobia bacterium]